MLLRALRPNSVRHTVQQVRGGRLPQILSKEPINVPLTATELAAYESADSQIGLQRYHSRTKVSRSAAGLVPAAVRYLTESEGTRHSHSVVFTENMDLFVPLVEELRRRQVPLWTITGEMTPKQRDDSVSHWVRAQRGCLVGTGAVETGLNLQRGSLLVSVVQTWNPERERQREGRLVRIGSDHHTVVHQVIRPEVPLEWWKDAKHERKQQMAQRVLAEVPGIQLGVTS